MTSPRGPIGFLTIVLIALLSSDHAETKINSMTNADVPFPPAAPTTLNLGAICQKGHCRPRYLASFFPRSGASHFRRRGKAINRLESWYSLCCGKPEAQKLCCAQQAWKLALSQFCVEEFSTKTLAYECCEFKGDARWSCFDSELPNPDYSCVQGYTAPTVLSEPGFTFNQDACQI
ncbi:extracellular matrix protein 1 [Fundulus heteroclitus]|uniref:extracellular matrix protein 1 n=1 Tax=Fundulus heteroclitus TaxID=8078 RepID=UPI00165A385E|nr:extracellular matrix protein 1 [Fundulus heteroclitus]